MKIEIAARLRPFSKRAGIFALIPRSPFAAEVFPTLIRLYEVSGPERKLLSEKPILHEELPSPENPFTLFQDLERGVLSVLFARKRLHILPTLDMIETHRPPSLMESFPERLSLGSHRKQEWERIASRIDLQTLFPLWYRLASLAPTQGERGSGGIFSLLLEIQELLAGRRPERLMAAFRKLFLAGFKDMLVPRLQDEEHRALAPPLSQAGSPLLLLKESAALMRALFVEEGHSSLSILPNLPPELPEGRFINIALKVGRLHIEWSKKATRLMILEADNAGSLLLKFPSSVEGYRLRRGASDRGIWLKNEALLEINPGERYLLDRFQK